MLHIRVVCPADRTGPLQTQLLSDPAVINIVVAPGAALRPEGDLVQFDVASEAANEVIRGLRDLDLHRCGSIAIERIDTALSDAAALAEARAPGDSTEAVIWEEVEARVRDDSELSWSLVLLVVLAVLIAAIGILTDSPILIVGAMVVGPEYGPLASIAVGLHRNRPARVRRGLVALGAGFGVAIPAAIALTAALRATGQVGDAYLAGARPLTSFISHPDVYSVIVAVLAGIAGTLSLTQSKTSSLVGVLISVTTIPAAANVGVAVVFARWGEAAGALVQLIVNFAALIVVGAATFRAQWIIWRRVAARR